MAADPGYAYFMSKGRLEAFSDGVLAIILTIMVIEFHSPHGDGWADLLPLLPRFLSYAVSFTFVAIYWNNHHHLLQAARGVSGGVLWANAHLLFWLSLIPFATAWLGDHNFAPWPVALYGTILLACGIAYYILERMLICVAGQSSEIAKAVGNDRKGKWSVVIYALAIALAFVHSWVSYALYVFVAVWWLIPDRRIEMVLRSSKGAHHD